MFGSVTLDVAIALVLMYSLLSLICSTINEAICTFMALRAKTLKSALDNLLGEDLAKDTYGHHLVQGLVKKGGLGSLMWWKKKPSYIQTPTFVLTVLDALGRLNGGTFPLTVTAVRAGAMKVKDENVQKALLALIDSASNFDELKANLGTWYDHSMERVSGWYKRQVQIIIRVIALLVAFGLGVDTLKIVDVLQSNPALRAGMVAAAQKAVKDSPTTKADSATATLQPMPATPETKPSAPPAPAKTETPTPGKPAVPAASSGAQQANPEPNSEAKSDPQAEMKKLRTLQAQFSAFGLPSFPFTKAQKELAEAKGEAQQGAANAATDQELRIEATLSAGQGRYCLFYWWLCRHLLGFFITAVAISLGAPFWFDLLNKLVSLRSSGERPTTQPAK